MQIRPEEMDQWVALAGSYAQDGDSGAGDRVVMLRRLGISYCWGVLTGPRLRQVALVARDCGQVAGELRRAFGWPPPFHDPGVGRFGLANAVFAVGDTFVEVVAPAQPDTT